MWQPCNHRRILDLKTVFPPSTSLLLYSCWWVTPGTSGTIRMHSVVGPTIPHDPTDLVGLDHRFFYCFPNIQLLPWLFWGAGVRGAAHAGPFGEIQPHRGPRSASAVRRAAPKLTRCGTVLVRGPGDAGGSVRAIVRANCRWGLRCR